jgi:hypothetical protein
MFRIIPFIIYHQQQLILANMTSIASFFRILLTDYDVVHVFDLPCFRKEKRAVRAQFRTFKIGEILSVSCGVLQFFSTLRHLGAVVG